MRFTQIHPLNVHVLFPERGNAVDRLPDLNGSSTAVDLANGANTGFGAFATPAATGDALGPASANPPPCGNDFRAARKSKATGAGDRLCCACAVDAACLGFLNAAVSIRAAGDACAGRAALRCAARCWFNEAGSGPALSDGPRCVPLDGAPPSAATTGCFEATRRASCSQAEMLCSGCPAAGASTTTGSGGGTSGSSPAGAASWSNGRRSVLWIVWTA